MVIGVGIDLVEVSRLEQSLARFGDRFLQRVFTERERLYCSATRHPAQHFAARFAAKEAAAKALGTGLSQGIGWQQIEVVRLPGHAPELVLTGAARDRADLLQVDRTHLSLTHTDMHATAVVVLESAAAPVSATLAARRTSNADAST